jgi:D-sedoheptulose 7-phosphate isomerase
MKKIIEKYSEKLNSALSSKGMSRVPEFAELLMKAWKTGSAVYICGNGGSAGNAIHLANDFIYGIDKKNGLGLRIEALSANAAVLTCLANDTGYENIYAQQLRVKAVEGDLLIVLSGSGNSQNIIKALEVAKTLGMKSVGILGYSGGKCLALLDCPIHIEIDDMQVSEDMQLIIGHMCMQYLCLMEETK